MATKKTKREVIKQNLGVDISKDDFKVCFYRLDTTGTKSIKGARSFKNTSLGFKELMKWVEKHRVANLEVHITIEATGVYYENLVHFLHEQAYVVSVILPNQSKAYAKSLNLKTKTDKIDAKMLGQLGIERKLLEWQPVSDNIRTLKQLTRDRISMLDEKTAIKNRLHALDCSFKPHKQVIKRMKQRIRLLEKQVQEVEKQIKSTIETDQILKQKIENICEVKGLGLVTVATIIAETNGFTLFTSRGQLVSYAGYDVVEHQSGSSVNGKTRVSKKGNSHIRRALHFPALCLVKYEPQFKQFFNRILDRSAIKMKAYVAVQRKALLLIYTLFKNDTVYDANYENNKNNKTSSN